MTRAPRLLATVACLLAAGCGRDGAAAESLPPLSAVGGGLRDSTATVCESLVHPTDGYGNISAIAPGAGARLAWADLTAGQVMLHDAAGQFKVVGRSGSDPGQFGLMGGLGWVGDSLWVSEVSQHRVQYFDDTGALQGMVSLPTAALVWIPRPRGRYVALATRPPADSTWALVATRGEGAPVDTVATFPAAVPKQLQLPVAGGMALDLLDPFGAQTWVVRNDDGSRWCAAMPLGREDLRLQCVTDGGAPVLDTVLAFAPRPIPREAFDTLVSRYVLRYSVELTDLLRVLDPQAALPVVNAMRVDISGDIWINRAYPTEAAGLWIRIRRDGAVRDTLVLPSRLAPRGLRHDTLWSADRSRDLQQPVVARCVVR